MGERNRVNICSVAFDNVHMCEALGIFNEIILSKISSIIVTPNVDHIVKLQKDQEFQRIYSKADLVLADGVPLLWAAKFLGTPLKEKISGSDLFPKICEMSAKRGCRLFFCGGREGAADAAKDILEKKYEELRDIGNEAKQDASRYSWSNAVKDVNGVYREILG